MSQFFASGSQYWSFTFNISPSSEHSGLISLGWTGWISLQSKGLSRVFSNTTVQQHQFFSTQLSLQSNSHPYMTTGKTIALTRQTFVGKVMSLLFNMLSVLLSGFGWFLSSSNTVSWCFLSSTGDCCLAEMQNGMGKGP